MWRTLHCMKHCSAYVVQTTTKPKYIHVAHTTLHEALQYICSAHNNKAKVHPGTAHKYNQVIQLRNGTPKFPPLSRPPSARSPFATPVRPPDATGQHPEAPAAGAPRARHCAWGPCSRAPKTNYLWFTAPF
jgi:hypothetical protein